MYYLVIVISIICLTSLILSILAISKNCKCDNFAGNILNESECYNTPQIDTEEKLNNCLNNIRQLSTNINTVYWGQPGNRGLVNPGGAISGSIGNPQIIN